MKEKFRQFMIGRYGNDAFNQFLTIVALAFWVFSLIFSNPIISTISLALLIYINFRMFSRNISKRTAENYKYYTIKEDICAKLGQKKNEFKNSKNYKYFRCPACKQKLRVPRGRGKIEISCPKCSKQFLKKS